MDGWGLSITNQQRKYFCIFPRNLLLSLPQATRFTMLIFPRVKHVFNVVKAAIIVVNVHLLILFVVNHVLRRLKLGFGTRKNCPIPLNRAFLSDTNIV